MHLAQVARNDQRPRGIWSFVEIRGITQVQEVEFNIYLETVSRQQFEDSCRSNKTSSQPNLDLMMEKLNCAAVEAMAFKAQGDNRAAKEEDRTLRDNIANATHSGNGKLAASRKL